MTAPLIRTGLKHKSLGRVAITTVFEQAVKKGKLDVLAIIDRGGGPKLDVAQKVAIRTRPATVKPWPHHEGVTHARVILLNRLISVECSIKILSIEPPTHCHHRRFDVSQVWQYVARLPVVVVVRMGHHFVPEWHATLQVSCICV
jgi:hypothetical protein